MKIVRTIAEVRAALAPRRRRRRSASCRRWARSTRATWRCSRAARAECDTVVVSLFVNPAQFGEREDLEPYPRDEAHDAAARRDAGVDVLFAPAAEEIYPDGFQTWVDVTELGVDARGRVPARATSAASPRSA